MSETPIDPLFKTNYIYSLANNKKEFEILAVFEWWDLTQSILMQANAETKVIPKIIWNYNWVFLKTETFIFPTPTIITSLDLPEWWVEMDAVKLQSQVISWWKNIPGIWTEVLVSNWNLVDLNLEVYEWNINSSSSSEDKISAIEAIQNTYNWSSIEDIEEIKYLLSVTEDEDKLDMLEIVVLNKSSSNGLNNSWWNSEDEIDFTVVEVCSWKKSWDMVYEDGTIDGSTLTCNDNIAVCSWDWTWYIVAACNQWTIAFPTASDDSNWYWNYFQFGVNEPRDINNWWSSNSLTSWWVSQSNKSTATFQNSTVSEKTSMKWPCWDWYHIPTRNEWNTVLTNAWITNKETAFNSIKLPASSRNDHNAWAFNINDDGNVWYYWLSSPKDWDEWDYLYFHSTAIGYRSVFITPNYWFTVRCFKD